MNKLLMFIEVYASTGKKRPLKTDGDTLKLCFRLMQHEKSMKTFNPFLQVHHLYMTLLHMATVKILFSARGLAD